MRRRFFKGFSAPVDLSDELYIKNEKERFVPFSVSPFKERRVEDSSGEEEEEGERPPEWLELAGDLAWTATFSSLTSNTSVTEPSAVWNYAVFFCLTWHLWATQTAYDIRYYTNDWWHRILFASQLGVYAILAAFSGSFNVSWEVDTGATNVFVGNTTQLTAQAMQDNQDYLITKSFRSVNILFFISRMLLFAQYARVMWYRRRTQQFWSWRFILTPLSLLFAAAIFLTCFIMIRDDPDSKAVAISQLVLWGAAILAQAVAGAYTPDDGEDVLKGEGAMAPRLASLTVIIIGEGLNAICGTLRSSMNSLGLSKTMVGQSVTILLILYFVWLLYFDGFRINYTPSKVLEQLWLYMHFPLHLSLILLLEGVKNVYIYVNVVESFDRLNSALDVVITAYHHTGVFPEHPRFEKLLRVLQISWQQETNDLAVAIAKDNAIDPSGNYTVSVDGQWARWWGTVAHGVILLFNGQPDPEAEFDFQNYTSSSDAVLAADANDPNSPLLSVFVDRYFNLMEYTGHWLVAVAGTLIVCMAILNVMQRQPGNRFSWGYSLSRTIMGCILIVVGGITSPWVELTAWIIWILPTIALGYGITVVVDWILLFFSVRSIRNIEGSSRSEVAYSSVETGKYDTGTGPNLGHLSQLSYGPGLGEEGSTPYSQGGIDASDRIHSASEGAKVDQYDLPLKS